MGKWGTLSTPYSLTNSEMRRTKHTMELVRGEDKMWKGRYYAHYFTLKELLELFSKVKGLKVVKNSRLARTDKYMAKRIHTKIQQR